MGLRVDKNANHIQVIDSIWVKGNQSVTIMNTLALWVSVAKHAPTLVQEGAGPIPCVQINKIVAVQKCNYLNLAFNKCSVTCNQSCSK